MKITGAFLFLGICLALTNAFIVPQKKKMSQLEAFANARLMTVVMKRWNDWQSCHKCSVIERSCMERAIVEDTCFILKLLINDMGCSMQQFLGGKKVQFQFHVTFIINAVEHDDTDSLTNTLKSHGLINHFVQTVCGLMNSPLKESNVEMGSIFSGVNDVLGGGLNTALNLVHGVVGGVLGGAVGAVGGLVDAATGIASGLTNTATGLVGGLGGAAGGIVGGLGNAASGVVGGLTHAAGGLAGGLVDTATGIVGGLADTATGIVGGLGKTAGGIVGGLLGGLTGGKKGLLG